MTDDFSGVKVKCVVWDLDNTLWKGVLLEEGNVSLREGIREIVEELDHRGILQSIASKNDHFEAMAKLKDFGLSEYFLYPQINWNPKSTSIKDIVKALNIGMDVVAFIDDQPFERDEVKFSLPQVLCLDAADLDGILNMQKMTPQFTTEDSSRRRQMYLNDIKRNLDEEEFCGTKEEFLSNLGMVLTISPVVENDLQRAEELTVRTHQLNSTGYTYSYEELEAYSCSDKHKLLIAGLVDKYGTYGKIGLALVECDKDVWIIKLVLMSCRVMSRGIGSIMINYIRNIAKKANVKLLAEFVPNEVNRMMYVTYRFAEFKEIEERDGLVIFENDLSNIPPYPEYVDVVILNMYKERG